MTIALAVFVAAGMLLVLAGTVQTRAAAGSITTSSKTKRKAPRASVCSDCLTSEFSWMLIFPDEKTMGLKIKSASE